MARFFAIGLIALKIMNRGLYIFPCSVSRGTPSSTLKPNMLNACHGTIVFREIACQKQNSFLSELSNRTVIIPQ